MKRLFALVLSGLLATQPAVAQQRCITTPEAEAIALVTMPSIIRQTGLVCATRLSGTSLVRRTDGPFLAKYDAAADGAWPVARSAIVKLSDPAVQGLLDSAYARSLVGTLVAPLLVGQIAPEDCGTIDRLVTQLAPLPPRNTASVIVTTLQYLKSEKAKGKNVAVPDLPLCAAPR